MVDNCNRYTMTVIHGWVMGHSWGGIFGYMTISEMHMTDSEPQTVWLCLSGARGDLSLDGCMLVLSLCVCSSLMHGPWPSGSLFVVAYGGPSTEVWLIL